jgi:hypothetical protein
MENDYKLSGLIDKNSLRTFFKEYIEDTRASIEKKTQEMLKLINSAKEENENFISKSK